MAIIYPRETPGRAFQSVDFKLLEIAVLNTLQNGAIQTMDLGPSLWRAEFTTIPLYPEERGAWQAWAMSLRGGRNFVAHDPEKVYPAAYGKDALALSRAIGGAFDGTASLAAFTATTIQLMGLPAGYQATSGDMLSFPWNGLQALHQVVEDAAANSSGIVTLNVGPPVLTNPAPTVGATVTLIRPVCVMKIVPGSFEAPASPIPTPVRFQGVQAIA
ncbi:hypothetical protein V5F41_03260 [Xanthobacter autotrophicus]|uniref:hypothetical protein n=1 Tax=Xanthobacter autotrophicus TaxID=280 RepID=UPI003729E3F6